MVRLCIEKKWHVLENIWTQDHGRMVFIVLSALLSLNCYMATISWAKRDLQSCKHISGPTRTPQISAEPEHSSFTKFPLAFYKIFCLIWNQTTRIPFLLFGCVPSQKKRQSQFTSLLLNAFLAIPPHNPIILDSLSFLKHPFNLSLVSCSLLFCSSIPLSVRLFLFFSPCHTSMHLTAVLLGY